MRHGYVTKKKKKRRTQHKTKKKNRNERQSAVRKRVDTRATSEGCYTLRDNALHWYSTPSYNYLNVPLRRIARRSCTRRWRASSSERAKRRGQSSYSHAKGRSPVCVRMCVVR